MQTKRRKSRSKSQGTNAGARQQRTKRRGSAQQNKREQESET